MPFVFTETEILFVLSEPNVNLAPFSPDNAPAQTPVNVYAEDEEVQDRLVTKLTVRDVPVRATFVFSLWALIPFKFPPAPGSIVWEKVRSSSDE